MIQWQELNENQAPVDCSFSWLSVSSYNEAWEFFLPTTDTELTDLKRRCDQADDWQGTSNDYDLLRQDIRWKAVSHVRHCPSLGHPVTWDQVRSLHVCAVHVTIPQGYCWTQQYSDLILKTKLKISVAVDNNIFTAQAPPFALTDEVSVLSFTHSSVPTGEINYLASN